MLLFREALEDGDDVATRVLVQSCGGLIREDELWSINERASDGNALPLAAGESLRLVCHPFCEAELG